MKLTYINNWEYLSYFVDGKPIKLLKKVKIGMYHYTVTKRIQTKVVHDMGHQYDVAATHYYIDIPFAGVNVPADIITLMELGVIIEPVEYTLEK